MSKNEADNRAKKTKTGGSQIAPRDRLGVKVDSTETLLSPTSTLACYTPAPPLISNETKTPKLTFLLVHFSGSQRTCRKAIKLNSIIR